MTHKYGNSGNDVAICRVGNLPEHGISLHIKVDIWHPAVGNWVRTLPLGIYFPWDIYRDPPPFHPKNVEYQSWYLTPCCGLEVQRPIQAPKSVKDPGNTFDLSPEWEWTLPSFGNFSWDIYRQLVLNQTVLELDFWAVKCLFFPRLDLNSHHWYTAAPIV